MSFAYINSGVAIRIVESKIRRRTKIKVGEVFFSFIILKTKAIAKK
jgi:hypothetical protein